MIADSSQIELVREFHCAADIPVRDHFPPRLDRDEVRKLSSLLDEEVAELSKAFSSITVPGSNSSRATLDAIGDICYVAIGAALQLGIPLQELLTLWVTSILSKVGFDTDEPEPLDNAAEKYWQEKGLHGRPVMSLTLRKYGRRSDPILVQDIDSLLPDITHGQSLFKSGLAHHDEATLGQAIAGLVEACFLLACRLGFHLATAFEEIHRSNMTKIAASGVERRADGKILKGPDFSPPDLSSGANSADPS